MADSVCVSLLYDILSLFSSWIEVVMLRVTEIKLVKSLSLCYLFLTLNMQSLYCTMQ